MIFRDYEDGFGSCKFNSEEFEERVNAPVRYNEAAIVEFDVRVRKGDRELSEGWEVTRFNWSYSNSHCSGYCVRKVGDTSTSTQMTSSFGTALLCVILPDARAAAIPQSAPQSVVHQTVDRPLLGTARDDDNDLPSRAIP